MRNKMKNKYILIIISVIAISFILIFILTLASSTVYQSQPGDTSDIRAQGCAKMRNIVGSNDPAKNVYNKTCNGTYPAVCGSTTSNDLLSCNESTGLETETMVRYQFTGVNMTASNNTIANCQKLYDVFLCYRWFVNGGTLANCFVAVDANGGASYNNVTTTCPTTTGTLTCTNVTATESWTCNSFFGATGTRALARTQIYKSNTGTHALSIDALFFNITYTDVADTCTYTSGNWAVNCADNCTITTNYNLNNKNLTFTGLGKFVIKANITTIDMINISKGCMVNITKYYRLG